MAEGQRRCQPGIDPVLGWTTLEGRDCLVRHLADHEAVINPADLKGRVQTVRDQAALVEAVHAGRLTSAVPT